MIDNEKEAKQKLKRFFELLNSAETNDEGRLRRHVYISSSRVMITEELGKLLPELEKYCGYELPLWIKQLEEED